MANTKQRTFAISNCRSLAALPPNSRTSADMYSTRAAKHILVSSFIAIVVGPENNCNCDREAKRKQ
jgi:hypothetical protein